VIAKRDLSWFGVHGKIVREVCRRDLAARGNAIRTAAVAGYQLFQAARSAWQPCHSLPTLLHIQCHFSETARTSLKNPHPSPRHLPTVILLRSAKELVEKRRGADLEEVASSSPLEKPSALRWTSLVRQSRLGVRGKLKPESRALEPRQPVDRTWATSPRTFSLPISGCTRRAVTVQ